MSRPPRTARAPLGPPASLARTLPLLRLDANEGPAPSRAVQSAAATPIAELLRRYPDARPLEAELARRHGFAPEQVLVTAGGDEALDRFARTFASRGREVVLPRPTFEMLERYLAASGARVRPVAWRTGPFPVAAFVRAARRADAWRAIVSPNNPTGLAATPADLAALRRALPRAPFLLDLAYAEYADADLTAWARADGRTLLVRTFSKAFGLAGARVGWIAGPAAWIGLLRAGSPFPVAGLSLALATAALHCGGAALRRHVARIRVERRALRADFRRWRIAAPPSQTNFLLARCRNAAFLHAALAAQSIAVRRFPARPGLDDALRITLPGAARPFARLRQALAIALEPQALLLDLDGVIADTGRSYDASIVATAAQFGIALTADDLAAARAEGNANDDWRLTQRLLERRGVAVPLEQVTARFEALYQGTARAPGLRRHETLAVPRRLIAALARRLPLALVTGRPRSDARRFLARFRLAPLFAAVVTREQGQKPSPAPVQAALRALRVERAWMAGDLPDDVAAARAAGCLALGVVPPREPFERRAALLRASGAAAVLPSLAALPELLP